MLDVNTGTWSRVLPSGDPGDDGNSTFPSPREGSAAFAFTSALVGNSRSSASDTIVFGGRDASGQYLSETWLLRAYNGTIMESQQTWSGFGDGRLRTGVNANGAGVTLHYMSTCAIPIIPTSSNASHAGSGGTSSFPYETSLSHKVLAPLSIALLLPAVLVFRLGSPSYHLGPTTDRHMMLVYLSGLVALMAYGTGLAGLATSFTTITSSEGSSSSGVTLRTAHGKAGLILFVGLYTLIPVLPLLSTGIRRPHLQHSHHSADQKSEKSLSTRPRINSSDTAEILSPGLGHARGTSQSVRSASRPPSIRPRVHSWGPVSLWCQSHDGQTSSDSESVLTTPATQGFEVLNRPSRTRTTTVTTAESQLLAPLRNPPTNLQDIDWLRRRRSLNAVVRRTRLSPIASGH